MSPKMEQTSPEEQYSPARLRDILDSVSDSLAVLGRNWVVLYANDAEHNHKRAVALGLSSGQDIVGLNFWDMLPLYQGTVAEMHLHTAMEHSVKQEWEIQSPYTGRWLKMFAYPSADGITLFSVDITERKLSEEALCRSEERHSFLLRLAMPWRRSMILRKYREPPPACSRNNCMYPASALPGAIRRPIRPISTSKIATTQRPAH